METSPPLQNCLRSIPKTDRVLAWPMVSALLEPYGRPEVVAAVQETLGSLRDDLTKGGLREIPSPGTIAGMVADTLRSRARLSLRQVINGTGVVVHTNLGRSPLARSALEAIQRVAGGYSNLEFDLTAGERGTRYSHVEPLICELTGAQAALVVNNNAAAVILALSSLARGREVVVSRGELVEIGGSFRIPEVMAQSGAIMVETGTTNRTHPRDYQTAISAATALLLKVHTSNYAIVGFTAEAGIPELAGIGRAAGIPVMLDAGSGCLLDLTPYGIDGEPTIRRYLDAGADLVTFSGDKLLGGPQAGIIAGRRDLIEPMRRHPLLRALRMDKLSLAALEATLRLYRDHRQAVADLPTLRMLAEPADGLTRRADLLKRRLMRHLPATVSLIRHSGESSAGGGAFPLLRLPTSLLEVRMAGASPERIEQALRRSSTPVIGRIHRDRFLLDVRTILDEDTAPLARSLAEAAAELTGAPP